MGARCWVFAALLAFVAACGEDVLPPTDAATDTAPAPDGAPMLVVPDPPMAPAMVDFGVCPDGWRSIDVSGASACEPWETGGPGCSGTDVRFPGDATCGSLGPLCPTGRFPTDVAGPAIYVEAEAIGGDGLVDTPFGTIGEAVAVATSGDTIVAGAGTYREEIALPDGVSLRGACVEGTIIEGAEGPLNAATVLLGEGSVLRDLTVRGMRPGVRADGVAAEVLSVRVEADEVGVVVIAGGELRADGLVVVGTTGGLGAGLFMLSQSRATIERAWFDDNRTMGVAVGDAGTELTLRKSVIQRTRADSSDGLGMGIVVNSRGGLVLEESVVRENLTGGVFIQEDGTGTIRTSVLRGNLSGLADGLLGIGLVALSRGTVTVEGSLLEGNQSAALSVTGLNTRLDGRDVILLDTLGQDGASQSGIGAVIGDGGTATLERVMVRGGEGLGVSVTGRGARLSLTDAVIRDVLPRPSDMAAGRGIDVEREALADLERVLVENVYASGILSVDVGSMVTLTDVRTSAIRSDARSRASGRGVTLQLGGSIMATRLLVEASRDAGILAFGDGSELVAVDLSVEQTMPRECAVDTCIDYQSGSGISATEGAVIDLTRFRVADSALAGLQVAKRARLTARDGVVERNAVGVNAQDPGFDPADVSMNVRFIDNVVNLDATALPVPELSER